MNIKNEFEEYERAMHYLKRIERYKNDEDLENLYISAMKSTLYTIPKQICLLLVLPFFHSFSPN